MISQHQIVCGVVENIEKLMQIFPAGAAWQILVQADVATAPGRLFLLKIVGTVFAQ